MDSGQWISVRDGVWRRPLAENSKWGVQMDMMRIDPEFTDVPHLHSDLEWVYILDGELIDSRGTHKKGDFLVNDTKEVHQPRTNRKGCLLLIVWAGSVKKV